MSQNDPELNEKRKAGHSEIQINTSWIWTPLVVRLINFNPDLITKLELLLVNEAYCVPLSFRILNLKEPTLHSADWIGHSVVF